MKQEMDMIGPLGRPHRGTRQPLERALLEQAASWLVRLKAGPLSTHDEHSFSQWLERSEQHRQAWTLAQAMMKQLDEMPAELARPVLARPGIQRRRAVGTLAGLIVTGLGLGLVGAQQAAPWQTLLADLTTATGSRRKLRLNDGSLLELNTATAVDVQFDDTVRALRLYRGEILITTGKDTGHDGAYRPFVVDTAQGRIHALGTRFSVRENGVGQTQVIVYEDAVDVLPAQNALAPRRLEPLQQVSFSASKVTDTRAAPVQGDAWTRGIYVAVDERLDDFLAEIGRYHRGVILCDDAVAHLHVTGTYLLDDVPTAIASLQDSHPVRVSQVTRHLIRVSIR